MPLAHIGLGSNLGDRMAHLGRALRLFSEYRGVRVLRTSPVYQNRAVGMGREADDFLNAVAEIETTVEPLGLLDFCLKVERQLGRARSRDGWEPRTIDLDILCYEGVRLRNKRLVLPHPRIADRDFVAVPLADLSPELEIDGRSAAEIVESLPEEDLKVYAEKVI